MKPIRIYLKLLTILQQNAVVWKKILSDLWIDDLKEELWYFTKLIESLGVHENKGHDLIFEKKAVDVGSSNLKIRFPLWISLLIPAWDQFGES